MDRYPQHRQTQTKPSFAKKFAQRKIIADKVFLTITKFLSP